MKLLSFVWLFATPWTVIPGSSVHGIFQGRVLEWVAIFFSWGSSRPRDRTWVSHIVCRRFTIWATREAQLEWEKIWHWYFFSSCLFRERLNNNNNNNNNNKKLLMLAVYFLRLETPSLPACYSLADYLLS